SRPAFPLPNTTIPPRPTTNSFHASASSDVSAGSFQYKPAQEGWLIFARAASSSPVGAGRKSPDPCPALISSPPPQPSSSRPAPGLAGVAAVLVEEAGDHRPARGQRGDHGAVADLVVHAGVVGRWIHMDEVARDAPRQRRVLAVHARIDEADGDPGALQPGAQR